MEGLQKDQFYAQFQNEDLSVTRFASDVIRQSSVDSSLEKLRHGVGLLDAAIREEVTGSTGVELLKQVSYISELDDVLTSIKASVSLLNQRVDAVRCDVAVPLASIQTKTRCLSNAHETCEVLRGISRYLSLCSRLKRHVSSGANQLHKAASVLRELQELRDASSLGNIEAIAAQEEYVQSQNREVIQSAQRLLSSGLDSLAQSDVANALLAFNALHLLRPKVQQMMAILLSKIRKSVDAQASSLASVSPEDESQLSACREQLWAELKSLFSTITTVTLQLCHLQRVMLRVNSLTTQQPLWLEYCSSGAFDPLLHDFWPQVATKIISGLSYASSGSAFVDSCFAGDYPQLCRSLQRFFTSIQSSYEVSQLPELYRPQQRHLELLQTGLSHFQSSYLSASLRRLFMPIEAVQGVTSADLIPIFVQEFEYVSELPRLSALVSRNVAKAVKLFCVKTEGAADQDDACFLLGPRVTDGQRLNALLCNSLASLESGVKSVSLSLGGDSGALSVALSSLEAHQRALLSPLFDSVRALCFSYITDMIQGDPKESAIQVQNTLQHLQQSLLSLYQFSPVRQAQEVSIAQALSDKWISVAATCRCDIMTIIDATSSAEAAIVNFSHAVDVSDLRGFKRLVVCETSEQLLQLLMLDKVTDVTTILWVISRLPPEDFVYPSLSEALDLSRLKNSLKQYEKIVNDRGDTQYHPLYPVGKQLVIKMLRNQ